MAELTPNALDALLASLGSSEEAVAASLRRRGVKGRPGRGDDCPLARLLRAEFPGHAFSVSPHAPAYALYEMDRGRIEIDCEGRALLPAACCDFAIGFDRGEYPGLEDKSDG